MTKRELATLMATRSDISCSDALTAIETLMEAMSDAFAQKENVTLRGFGTFQVVHREAKKGQDITRKMEVIIPAHDTVKFVPSKTLKRCMEKCQRR